VSCNADSIGDFDPVTGSFSALDISRVISHDYKYFGGVLAPYGHIYFVPHHADSIGDICPDTGAFPLDISSFISHDLKFFGGVLAPNGHIYFVPYHANSVGDRHRSIFHGQHPWHTSAQIFSLRHRSIFHGQHPWHMYSV